MEASKKKTASSSGIVLLKERALSAGWPIKLASAGSLFQGVLIVLSAWMLADIVDGVVFKGATLPTLRHSLVVLALLFFMRAAVTIFSEAQGARGAIAVKLGLRRDLSLALRNRTRYQQGHQNTGGLLSTFVEGVEALHPYYARYLPSRAASALVPLGILAVVYPVDWISGLVMTVTAPLIPIFMILIGRGAERLNRKQWSRLTRLNEHFYEAIQGLSTLKLLNAEKRESVILQRSAQRFRIETMSVLRLAFMSALALEFFATVSIAIVAVLIGFRLLWGEIEFQRAFLVLLLAPEFYLPLRRMGVHYHARMDAQAAAEKIAEVLALQLYQSGGNSLQGMDKICVKFEGVSYFYGDRNAGIRDFTLDIPAGHKVALVGPSGCGKTTVLGLLLGLIAPQEGKILVNGRPLDTFRRQDWWQALGYMPQYAHLFAGDVADAICMGNRDASATEIDALARALGISDLLGNHVILEGGQGLSGGQLQRVSLARALIRPSSLLILDEPTSHLDPVSARLIETTIAAQRSHKTILIAAHRLDSIQDADHIVVMNEGKIAASGTHFDLLAQSVFYRECVDAMEGDGA